MMKTVTLNELRTRLDAVLAWVASGEEVQIVKENQPVARIMPPASHEVEWAKTFTELDKIWGQNPLPGPAASQLLIDGRR